MIENWRAVPGYEDLYSVSDQGRVRSEARTVAHIVKGKRLKERILAPRTNKATGYLTVNLSRNNQRKTFTLHVLIATAFLGPRPEGLVVAHRDGDKENCALQNLRYATPASNTEDCRKHGTLAKGTALPQAKLTDDTVRRIRSDKRLQRVIAAELGVSVTTISHAKNGVSWAHVR